MNSLLLIASQPKNGSEHLFFFFKEQENGGEGYTGKVRTSEKLISRYARSQKLVRGGLGDFEYLHGLAPFKAGDSKVLYLISSLLM